MRSLTPTVRVCTPLHGVPGTQLLIRTLGFGLGAEEMAQQLGVIAAPLATFLLLRRDTVARQLIKEMV